MSEQSNDIDLFVKALIRFGCGLYYQSRFFSKPSEELSDALRIIFKSLTVKIVPKKGKVYFRSRLHHPRSSKPKRPYSQKQIGAPPGDIATAGRLNSAGISRLYLASTVNVAATEIGAVTGDFITTVKFVPVKSIKAVDFRLLDKIEDPRLRPLASFIGRLLTAHVDSYHSYEMVLTQWLVELFEFVGCGAVIYKSVATGRESKTLRLDSLPPIEYYNICAFHSEEWKIVRGSAKILKVRYMDAGAFDDKTWMELQVLENLARNPPSFANSKGSK